MLGDMRRFVRLAMGCLVLWILWQLGPMVAAGGFCAAVLFTYAF
jgi:hypothetical protein